VSNVVYRFFAEDGELLYVGSTSHWPKRMQQHQTSRPWWAEVTRVTLEHHTTLAAARAAEAAAIIAEHPAYTLPPATTTARAWQARRATTAVRHAAGQFCGLAPCVTCRLRDVEAMYKEKVGGDFRSAVLELRDAGTGRGNAAGVLRRRMGLRYDDAPSITVGMIEMVERQREQVAS
jgi:predicted GIY-YIG superfamily endonuclease